MCLLIIIVNLFGVQMTFKSWLDELVSELSGRRACEA